MALSGSLTGISSDQVTGGTAGIKVYSNTSTAHHVNVQHTAEGTGLTTTMHCTCTRSQYTIAYVSIKEMGYTAAAAPPSFRHGEPALCGIGLSSVLRPRQWENFYRSKDPTNSIKILKEQIVHREIKHTVSATAVSVRRLVFATSTLFDAEMSVGPFFKIQSNPIHQITDPIQSNPP